MSEMLKYPERGENVPDLEKCYLCGEWKVMEHLYSVYVGEPGRRQGSKACV